MKSYHLFALCSVNLHKWTLSSLQWVKLGVFEMSKPSSSLALFLWIFPLSFTLNSFKTIVILVTNRSSYFSRPNKYTTNFSKKFFEKIVQCFLYWLFLLTLTNIYNKIINFKIRFVNFTYLIWLRWENFDIKTFNISKKYL